MSFLEYYRIRNAIPYQWRTQLRNGDLQMIEGNINELMFKHNSAPKSIQKITSADFYQYLIKNKYTDTPTAIVKWQQVLEGEINYEKAFVLCKRIGRTAKLHAFQFSILHQYVPHNHKLHKMKLINSATCNHCDSTDSVIHRFIECNDVKIYWNNVMMFFNNTHNTNFTLSKKQIMLGILEHTDTTIITCLNTYILIAKYWIHLCRLKQRRPELQGFTKLLSKHIENEKYLSTTSNTHGKHSIIWETLYTE